MHSVKFLHLLVTHYIKNFMKTSLLYILLFPFIAIYSQSYSSDPPDLSVEKLLSSPLQITVNGRILSLEASMSIDFMPSIPSGSKAVRTHCWLSTIVGSELPPSLNADAIWIVYKKQDHSENTNIHRTIKIDTTTK